jgi:hypothetical protein
MFRPAPFLVTLLDRVKAIVRRVARPVEARTRIAPPGARGGVAAGEPISPALRGLVQGWMDARLQALSALIRKIEAGESLETPVRAPLTAPNADAPLLWNAASPQLSLPRGFGWMCAFGPNVRRDGAAFAEWLNDPAMQARVLAAPERMAGLIGPILSATGQSRPEWFAAMPKRIRKNAFRSGGERPECGATAIDPGEVAPDVGANRKRQGQSLLSSRRAWQFPKPRHTHARSGRVTHRQISGPARVAMPAIAQKQRSKNDVFCERPSRDQIVTISKRTAIVCLGYSFFAVSSTSASALILASRRCAASIAVFSAAR